MSDTTDPGGLIDEAIRKAENGAQIYHDIANGPAYTYVDTESGPIPTVAEWFRVNAENIDNIDGGTF